ncbi:GTP--adenosylcobinamide-phosphate guanylyltransferase [Marinicaulis flavus]|uniref:GTP--adenosylcobinamide-phosphate guanylyltransferase n=1 Tax=Hyphococcus luteus TaxID=2058213 RepID=A0A2S7K3K6_9PROT|nr:GTP--adenosylcobinamide-phosphate guanylyltransferase [Marinicaulis flavus]
MDRARRQSVTGHDPHEAGYTAIVIAGKRPGTDPVAAARGQTYKALVEIHGQAMIARVLDALSQAPAIARIVLVTEDAIGPLDAIPGVAEAKTRLPVERVRAAPTISASVCAAIEARENDPRFLIATADHPLLTKDMVNDFLDRSQGKPGVSIALVARETIEDAYPQMQRTYLKFRGAEVSGANLFAINDRSGLNAVRFWEKVEANRKRPWKLAAAFGPLNLIGFALKLFSIDTAFRRAGKIVRCPAHAILLPYANAAIDVDKPSDLEQVEAILAAR